MLSLVFPTQWVLLCVWGCGQARAGGAAAGQVLQMSPSKQTAPLSGWWENVPFSLQRNVFSCLLSWCKCVLLPSELMSYLQLVFPLLSVLCRGTASKDVSAHKQRHLIKLWFWKGIGFQILNLVSVGPGAVVFRERNWKSESCGRWEQREETCWRWVRTMGYLMWVIFFTMHTFKYGV